MKSPGISYKKLFGLCVLLTITTLFNTAETAQKPKLRFEVSFPQSSYNKEITGRILVIVAKEDSREPRFQVSTHGTPFWGVDIQAMKPGQSAVVDGDAFGYPLPSLADLPPGEYFVQAFINVYTEFKRADGHTLWMHQDQWEGQRWNRSPGNLYSDVIKMKIDPAEKRTIRLECKNVIPPVEIPPDTKWVKRIKFQSNLLSDFWGQPMYLGATILLPKDYEKHSNVNYPVIYYQGHFSLRAPFGFRSDDPGDNRRARRGYDFYQHWTSDTCPRFIAVTFQHPSPYYDDSYAVNSPNTGPCGDAIMKELIPRIEETFRIIRKPWARLLTGGSTGGWISLALQVLHPEFFGGVWSLCPDPVDFRYFQAVNIYEDKNAFFKEFNWLRVPTPSDRTTTGIVRLTYQQRNHYELALGTKNRSGDQIDIFEAAFGPIGEDGYAKSLFDPMTGEIDSEVAAYWKEHYDIRAYLERNWDQVGSHLKGKIHIYTGDMDSFYLNNATKLLEEFLESTTDPYYDGIVDYGNGQPHCWGPRGADLLKLMAEHIAKHKPNR